MHGLNRPVTRQLPPVAQRTADVLGPARRRACRRVRLAARAQLAGGDARPFGARSADPQLPGGRERLYRGSAGRHGRAAGRALCRDEGRASRRTTARCRHPTAAWNISCSYVTGGQYPRLCRRPRGGGPEAILLDGNKEAEGQRYWQLGAAAHSPDHRYLAYAVDKKGSELFTIKIRDLATGKDLREAMPDTRSAIVWGADSKTLFYVRLDANQRPALRLPPSRRHGRQVGRADLRGEGQGLLRRRRPDPVRALRHHRGARSPDDRGLSDRCRPPGRRAPPGGAARAWPRVRRRAPRRHGSSSPPTPSGAEDFRICEAPVADPRRRQLARDHRRTSRAG